MEWLFSFFSILTTRKWPIKFQNNEKVKLIFLFLWVYCNRFPNYSEHKWYK